MGNEPRIKVAHVLSDTNIGGAGRWLLGLLANVDKTALDVRIVLPRGARLAPQLEAMGVDVTLLDIAGDKSLDWGAVVTLLRHFRSFKPDIVHTHAALSARIAARLAGAKVVYTRHSAFDLSPRDKVPLRKWAHGFVNSLFSHRIISVSPAATANLVETGTNPRLVTLIYNGVESPPLLDATQRGQLRKRLGFSQDDFVAAIIARLSSEKGHDIVLEAAKLAEGSRLKFAIAGDGSMAEHLRRRIHDEGITNAVMLGFVEDVGGLVNIMDAQINASIGAEATSLSLLEGMSLGKPSVVTNSGGNPYVVEHDKTGIVIPPGDAPALHSALCKLQDDTQLYAKMAQEARRQYQQRFTAASMTEQVVNIYSYLTLK